jgi:hypothetical protein
VKVRRLEVEKVRMRSGARRHVEQGLFEAEAYLNNI